MTVTVRTLAISVGFVIAATVSGVVMLFHDSTGHTPTRLSRGVPVVVTADGLHWLTGSTTPIYWAGPLPEQRLEVTTTRSGSFVRYLPPAARVGTSAKTLTIASYAVTDAWAVALRAAGEPGADRAQLADGTIAVWRVARPTNVYLARRGSKTLIEVFDPDASKAHRMSLSGLVQPVQAG
jgi:hypothetical protein